MKNDEIWQQARYIFTTGKLIHDRIDRIISSHLVTCEGAKTFKDLSLVQLHVVMNIRNQGAMSISDIARQMGVSPPSASVMVDRLVDKGILVRRQSTEDRRKVVVQISPETTKTSSEIENTILAFFVGMVEKIGPETTRKWCQVLEKIITVLESE
ncbi:MAG: MarR family transcriptional regulator [Desulfobacterales bacterium]|nr:MarR family transcriptional regulator [Desulfobacterales bacterium]